MQKGLRGLKKPGHEAVALVSAYEGREEVAEKGMMYYLIAMWRKKEHGYKNDTFSKDSLQKI